MQPFRFGCRFFPPRRRLASALAAAVLSGLALQAPAAGPAVERSYYHRAPVTRVYSAQAQAPYAQTALQEELQSPQTILARLKAANKIPDEVATGIRTVQSDSLNAATDGQSLVITSALLERLKTSDERAFVISHELSHIVLSHVGKTQLRRTGLTLLDRYLVRRYVSEGSLADMATQLGLNLYDKRSSRVYEYQADDLGIQIMSRAGYRPQAAIDVFHILEAATPGSQTPEFLQDHPITEARMQALVKKYNLSPR